VDTESFQVTSLTETTTKHMKEYGLFPSISRLCDYGEMPFELMKWSMERYANFIMDSFKPNRDEWWQVINRDYEAFREEFSIRGDILHMAIKCALDGSESPAIDHPTVAKAAELCIPKIKDWIIAKEGVEVLPERGYCDPVLGIAGTIDLDINGEIIADFKSKNTEDAWTKRKASDSNVKQVAGYCAIRKIMKGFVIPICCVDDHTDVGETEFIELTKDQLAWGTDALLANAEAWFVNKQYDPRQMYKDSKCMKKEDILGDLK